jgi:hypothetical protein
MPQPTKHRGGGNDKLRGFYDFLKSKTNVRGIPDNYKTFQKALSDPSNRKGFYHFLRNKTNIRGIPDKYERFSSLWGEGSGSGQTGNVRREKAVSGGVSTTDNNILTTDEFTLSPLIDIDKQYNNAIKNGTYEKADQIKNKIAESIDKAKGIANRPPTAVASSTGVNKQIRKKRNTKPASPQNIFQGFLGASNVAAGIFWQILTILQPIRWARRTIPLQIK